MTDTPRALPIDVREIVRVLWRRKTLLFVPWIVAFVTGLAAAFLLKPVYFSTATLMLETAQQLSGSLGGMVQGGPNPAAQADVMRDQMSSSLFLRGVITATGVKNDPATRAWALKSSSAYPNETKDEQVERFLIDYLRDG